MSHAMPNEDMLDAAGDSTMHGIAVGVAAAAWNSTHYTSDAAPASGANILKE